MLLGVCGLRCSAGSQLIPVGPAVQRPDAEQAEELTRTESGPRGCRCKVAGRSERGQSRPVMGKSQGLGAQNSGV